MYLPINGRVTIIDDQIEQAETLIKVLSKRQIPITYFSGELEFLPDSEDNFNDTRILFLDINLIDNSEHEIKVLKASLVPVLKKVISKDNFPYVLIYWSRHEEHKELIENDIFENDLNDRKPIAYISSNKSSFFNLDGTPTENYENEVSTLFTKLEDLIKSNHAFSYLLHWENQVHFSTDKTLQEVFSPFHAYNNWTDNANHLINKFSISYSGKSTFKEQSPSDKIKAAFNTFSNLLNDTIEKNNNSSVINNPTELSVENSDDSKYESYYSINKKLMFSDDSEPIEYPGAIIEDVNPKTEKVFEELFFSVFNRFIEEEKLTEDETKDLSKNKLNKLIRQKNSDKKAEIKTNWKRIYLTVTPLCDYVQSKYEYNRCVKGIIIESNYLDYIDTKSEAIFISPKFSLDDGISYVMILHFRYFFTSNKGGNLKNLNPLFRARQQLLAEIQSKLSRHISRQGILFLDDK